MPWFKVDDKLHDHRKARAAGVAAMGLWALAGSWCADNLTDGFVPDTICARWDRSYRKLAARLVDARLWVVDEVAGEKGWRFHEWDLMQPPAEATRAKRDHLAMVRSEAGRKGAHARWSDGKSHGKPPDVANGKNMAIASEADGKPMAPTRPDPTLPPPASSEAPPTTVATPEEENLRREAQRRLTVRIDTGSTPVLDEAAWIATCIQTLRRDRWRPPNPDFIPGTGSLQRTDERPDHGDPIPPELTRAGRHPLAEP